MSPDTDKSLAGIILMILAMGLFAITDTFIKIAAGTMSPAHTALFLMVGAAVIYIAMVRVEGRSLLNRDAFHPVLLARYTAEIIGTFSMITALSVVPLSQIGAILQATPLVVVAGAVVFLGEKVSWRRWTAIGVGFAGMLMIIRPGSEGFDLSVLWAIVAMLGLSVRDLTTRVTPRTMATTQLAAYTMIAATPVAIGWCLLAEETLLPVDPHWGLVAGMVGFGALGYLLLTSAVRIAPMSVVSPFRYSRLIFLLALGVILFDERPDMLMLAGAVLIIGSGIYTMWRDHQLGRARAAAEE